MKTLYFDCFSGASGDMIIGALLDAGADFDKLKADLASLNVPGYSLGVEKVKKSGIMATKFNVEVSHEEEHPHRHLRHIVEILDASSLPDAIKEASIETFRRIGEAEAKIHGTTVEKIHFHEVGAIDSIVDVVGAHLCLAQLGIEQVFASPLHVGSGTVKCAHGIMPVPAPATALLLHDAPTYGGDVEGELVTPTGAALVTQLAKGYGSMPSMRVNASGYGAGTKDIEGRPNALRVLIGQAEEVRKPTEPIVVIEANIDDMNPELFPPVMAALLRKGARDTFLTPILGKKGRPAYLVTVLCDEHVVTDITDVLLENTTTLGVRIRREERVVLDRDWQTVKTKWGEVRVKIGKRNGKITSRAPEFDDCQRLAEAADVPVLVVYEAALAAALQGEMEYA